MINLFEKLRTCLAAVAIFFLLAGHAAASSYFAYVSDRRVITVETVSENELVLNVINLSDEVLVVRPYDLLLQDGTKATLGHVFRRDDSSAADLFFATRLIKSREFVGLTVEGELMHDPEHVVFRTASRFFFLQKIERQEFDSLERRIAEIDLKRDDAELALKEAGIRQGYGRLEYYPEGETEDLNRLFPESGQALPPRVIKKVEPKAADVATPGSEVEVKGLVSKRGDLLDATVSRGISPEADQRALAVVRNSWKFLPAVLDGEVVVTSVTLRVRFVE